MRILGAVAVVALLAGPAMAQQVPKYGEPDKVKTQSEKDAEKEAEKAYKRSLNNIPEQKSADPWGTVRSDNSAPPKNTVKNTAKTADKAGAKTPAKPKAKSAESGSAGPRTDGAAKQ